MKKLICLISLSALFTACEKKEEEATPQYPASVFTVTQQPNQRLTFNFAFSAERENLITIRKAGQIILAKNIDAPDALTPFFIDYNTSTAPVTYEITHQFKVQRGNSPWLNGAGRADTISAEEISYGFDDRDPVDADYNDAMVNVITELHR